MFRRTQDPPRCEPDFIYGVFTLFDILFQVFRLSVSTTISESYNPNKQACWFGLFPFRSPLLRESNFLSLPAGTKMFQFSASTSNQLCIH